MDEKKETNIEKKQEIITENKSGKESSFTTIFLVMMSSIILVSFWEKIPQIKNSVHYILDPTSGRLLNWNLNFGMIIVVLIITILTTLIQKYTTDQKTLKELKKEQKELQEEMKKFKQHPEKLMELQKKQFALMPKQMKLSMRGLMFTTVPFILFFRWFNDYFGGAGNPKFWLGLTWFWFYLIIAIIIGAILRKQMDVV